MNLEEILPKIRTLSESEQAELLRLVEKLEQAKRVDSARSKFLPFVGEAWPGFIHGRHHEIMAEAFEKVLFGDSKRLIINLPPRHAIATDAKIPTIAGFKTMADIQVGDFVFGPDGLPVAVLGKSGVFQGRELYRVWTDDGAYLDVDGEHLWTVRLCRKYGVYKDYTTEQLWRRQNGEMIRTKRNGVVDFLSKRVDPKAVRLPRLPDVSAVQYPEANLPIDPYLLGLWLGDGASLQAIITMHTDDSALVRAEIERRGYVTTDQQTRFTFGILGLKVKLRELGVLGNKHIPGQYLMASEAQRRDLLKGLMDTDGNVSKAGQCFFTQSKRELCEQVQELIRSLGIKASLLESRAMLNGKDYGPTWKVSFYGSDIVFLPRKSDRTLKTERGFGRYIKIDRLGYTGDTQCIKVDRDDGLFLAGEGYICTHNTKSEFASYLLPAWFMGNFPDKKIIQATHTAELAVNFGRKVRNLINSEDFQKVFPDVKLQSDSKASGRWATSKGGEYFAVGVGGAIAGKGADLFIIDDPHTEQEAILAAHDPSIYDKVFDWYTSGPRQRLQPDARIVIVMTRWGRRDLAGRLVQTSTERGDGETEWEVIELPAILPSGNPLWPQFWKIEALEALKAELPAHKWNAQYQQQPTNAEGAILKREWWKRWPASRPPQCEYIIVSADTAFTKNNRSDYTAFTVWGVFEQPNDSGSMGQNLILLDAFKERMEFPELKQRALEVYKEWEPDTLMIEGKASGLPLIHELRQLGIPVSEFTPTRASGDKIMRANSISDMFASGIIWAPETRWADEVIEECASFPNGAHDDYVDAVIMALMRYRQGGFIRLPSDYEDEPDIQRRADYY